MSTMCFRFESHRTDNCPFSKDVDVNIWVYITQHSSHWVRATMHLLTTCFTCARCCHSSKLLFLAKILLLGPRTASVACSAQKFAFAFANPPLPRFSFGHSFFCTCLHSSLSSSFSCSAPAIDSHVFFRSWPHLAKPHLAKTAFGPKNQNLTRS